MFSLYLVYTIYSNYDIYIYIYLARIRTQF
jgi:hypothetical protein